MEGAAVMGVGVATLVRLPSGGAWSRTTSTPTSDTPHGGAAGHRVQHHPAATTAADGRGRAGRAPIPPALCQRDLRSDGQRIRRLPIRDQLTV